MKLFFVFFLPLTLCAVSFADVVRFRDGREKQGVILRADDENLIFALPDGDKELALTEIDGIEMHTEKDNLLFLAQRERAEGRVMAAYYIYRKILWEDLENSAALEGMELLDSEIFSPVTESGWTAEYERFQIRLDGKSDHEVLAENALRTEELLDFFGLVLASRSGRIKVTEVVKDSRAHESGIELNDILVEIDGRPTAYMGTFDAVDILLSLKQIPVGVVIERTVREGPVKSEYASALQLVEQEKKSPVPQRIVRLCGLDGKPFEGRYVESNDSIVSVKGLRLNEEISFTEAETLIRDRIKSKVEITLHRRVDV